MIWLLIRKFNESGRIAFFLPILHYIRAGNENGEQKEIAEKKINKTKKL